MTVAEDHILKIDVREIPRPERHPCIFGMLNSLVPGYDLILTVDHDPVPLYYHIEMHYDGMFDWEYLSRGPEIWEVRIREENMKAATAIAAAVIELCASDRYLSVAPLIPGQIVADWQTGRSHVDGRHLQRA